MNKRVYNAVSLIPVIGLIIQKKTNFFAFMCSPFKEELMQMGAYDLLLDWGVKHPDQTLSPKIAKTIIESVKEK